MKNGIARTALVVLTLAGLVGVTVFGWYALQDWAALRSSDRRGLDA